jgi:RHS repeat-associated protein
MLMPGRSYSIANTNYRYGFNGKEKDKEVVQYDYGFRIYDPRLVRFKSVDPLMKSYPWYTPYQFAGNTQIQAVDVDGLEPSSVVKQNVTYSKATIYPTEDDPNPKTQTVQVRIVTYKFTELATHLLSIVSGISEADIRKVNIQNGAGTLMPAYPIKDGGGAMTFPGDNSDYNINFTDNFFSHDGSEMGYGQNDFSNNVYQWLDLSSHEVGHIQDIKEIGGGKLKYFSTFLKDYIKAGNHDDNPREQRADYGQKVLERFTTFTNKNYGNGAIVKLFENKDEKEEDKIKTLDQWSKAFSKSEEERIFPNSTTGNSSSNKQEKHQ